MKNIKTLILAIAIMSTVAVDAMAEELSIDTSAINDSLNAMVVAKTNALNENLSVKVTAMIEAILKAGRVQREQVELVEFQPYSVVIFPVVEYVRNSYDLEENRS